MADSDDYLSQLVNAQSNKSSTPTKPVVLTKAPEKNWYTEDGKTSPAPVAPDAKPAINDKISEMREKTIKDIENTPFPTMAQAPVEQHTDPMKIWGSPAMWVATLGSLLTRRPLTAALNAAAAVNNAVAEGDDAAFKKHYDEWKVQSENGVKAAEWEMNKYKTLLSAYNAGDKSAYDELKILSAEAAAQMKLGTLAVVNEFKEAQTKLLNLKTEDYKSHFDDIQSAGETAKSDALAKGATPEQAEKAARDARQAASAKPKANTEMYNEWDKLSDADKVPGTNIDFRSVKNLADQYKYDVAAINRSGLPKEDREAVVRYASYLGNKDGTSGADIAKSRSEYKAGTAELTQLDKNEAKLNPAIAAADNFIDIAEPLLKKVDLSKYPTMASMEVAYQNQTGTPELYRLHDLLQEIASEHATILARGGYTSDINKKQALDMANEKLGSNALGEYFKIVKQAGKITKDSIENEKKNALPIGKDKKSAGEKIKDPESGIEYRILP